MLKDYSLEANNKGMEMDKSTLDFLDEIDLEDYGKDVYGGVGSLNPTEDWD